MSADLGIGFSDNDPNLFKDGLHLRLEDDGCYWFLYKYFESANLDRSHELIDLYGGGPINGYQLERLKAEMAQALVDVSFKPTQWKVLIGWNGSQQSKESEIQKEVSKDEMTKLIQNILNLISVAETRQLSLICSGD
jgi:hypothetical protein